MKAHEKIQERMDDVICYTLLALEDMLRLDPDMDGVREHFPAMFFTALVHAVSNYMAPIVVMSDDKAKVRKEVGRILDHYVRSFDELSDDMKGRHLNMIEKKHFKSGKFLMERMLESGKMTNAMFKSMGPRIEVH